MGNELDLIAAMTNAHLSDFDGKQVVRAAVALFGTDGLSEAMAVNPMEIPQGSEGVCVVRWSCAEVKLKGISKDTPDLLSRNHRLKILTVAFVDNKAVVKLLEEQEAAIRLAKDKARGIEALKAADGADPVGDAEKAERARKAATPKGTPKAPKEGDPDYVAPMSGVFKGEPFDAEKEKERTRRPRTPAAAKASVDEAVKAAEKLAAGKDASVTDIADARKTAVSDG